MPGTADSTVVDGSDGSPDNGTSDTDAGGDSTTDTKDTSVTPDGDLGADSFDVRSDLGNDADVATETDSAGGCSLTSAGDAGLAGSLNWASRFGITGSTATNAVAISPGAADVALAGYIAGSTDFGGGLLTNADAGPAGAPAGFLVKFDASGTYKLAKGITNIEPYGVSIDSSGNLVAGGNFSGATDFGGGSVTSTGDTDIFLSKYETTGKLVWAKHFGLAAKSSFFGHLSLDSSGNIYLAGEAGIVALDLGCGALPSASTYFIAKFDPSGACIWSHAPVVTESSELGIWSSVDSAGNVVVAGGFYGSIDFGKGPLTAPGTNLDAFVAKFDPSGAVLWAKRFDGTYVKPGGIGTDACGNILLAGDYVGTVDFGPGPMTTSTDSVFVTKLNASGVGVWSKSFVPTGSTLSVHGLAVDGAGSPAITGGFAGSIDFGGGGLIGGSSTYAAMFIAKFSSAGAYEWAYAGGPPGSTAGSGGEGIAANGVAVLAAGVFSGGTLKIAGKSMAAVSGDTYLASFAP